MFANAGSQIAIHGPVRSLASRWLAHAAINQRLIQFFRFTNK